MGLAGMGTAGRSSGTGTVAGRFDRVGLGLGLGLALALTSGEAEGEAEALVVGDGETRGEGDGTTDGEGLAEAVADGAVGSACSDCADGAVPVVACVQPASSPAHSSAVVTRRGRLTPSG